MEKEIPKTTTISLDYFDYAIIACGYEDRIFGDFDRKTFLKIKTDKNLSNVALDNGISLIGIISCYGKEIYKREIFDFLIKNIPYKQGIALESSTKKFLTLNEIFLMVKDIINLSHCYMHIGCLCGMTVYTTPCGKRCLKLEFDTESG